ncbi:MAG: methylmalonyl Co-A mutase-associated GTPase MeaB [Anaerolineaceae bacterium]|nr:methylmalonyl Co-A mutase-associated GTPase MeaB [Anaerolineaceae bacterium]
MKLLDPEALRQGNRLALSRALTAVENGDSAGQALISDLFPHTGNAFLVGITGAPGTGKSTLVNQLARTFRKDPHTGEQLKIAIVAVDPTSPFTGGALLGDRIRMQDLIGDPGIFIRSMASRGALGGLAHSTAAFTTLLDGAGFDLILVETVGAGQAEVDIAQLAHTVIVVEAPGLGDDIQAIKAGILEIGDILVVNKADQPGSENAVRALQAMLEMSKGGGSLPLAGKHLRQSQSEHQETVETQVTWKTPVLPITATNGDGIPELVEAIKSHRDHLRQSGLWQMKEAQRLEKDLQALIQDHLVRHWEERLDPARYDAVLNDLIERKISPQAALELLT